MWVWRGRGSILRHCVSIYLVFVFLRIRTGGVSMGTVAELIPQVFFDIYARYVPGLVLFGSWILLLGQDEWQCLLNMVAGGQLDSENALPIATLILLFV